MPSGTPWLTLLVCGIQVASQENSAYKLIAHAPESSRNPDYPQYGRGCGVYDPKSRYGVRMSPRAI